MKILTCVYDPSPGPVFYSSEDENGIDTLNEKLKQVARMYPNNKSLIMGSMTSLEGTRQDFMNYLLKDIPNINWYKSDVKRKTD